MINCYIELQKAFPSFLQDDINNITERINLMTELPANGGFEVSLGNELIFIPYRHYLEKIYNNHQEFFLSDRQNTIISCFLTRHHNGLIRESSLKKIIRCHDNWVVPFVMQLLGEYVIEILDVIYKNLDNLNMSIYTDFIKNNPQFYKLTKDRVISYWSCYYRWVYKYRKDYVGFKILTFFDEHLKT